MASKAGDFSKDQVLQLAQLEKYLKKLSSWICGSCPKTSENIQYLVASFHTKGFLLDSEQNVVDPRRLYELHATSAEPPVILNLKARAPIGAMSIYTFWPEEMWSRNSISTVGLVDDKIMFINLAGGHCDLDDVFQGRQYDKSDTEWLDCWTYARPEPGKVTNIESVEEKSEAIIKPLADVKLETLDKSDASKPQEKLVVSASKLYTPAHKLPFAGATYASDIQKILLECGPDIPSLIMTLIAEYAEPVDLWLNNSVPNLLGSISRWLATDMVTTDENYEALIQNYHESFLMVGWGGPRWCWEYDEHYTKLKKVGGQIKSRNYVRNIHVLRKIGNLIIFTFVEWDVPFSPADSYTHLCVCEWGRTEGWWAFDNSRVQDATVVDADSSIDEA